MVVRVRTTSPLLPPGVARSTQRIQTTLERRQVRGHGLGTLPGCLSRAINGEDDPVSFCSINKSTCLPFFVQWAREQIFEKERA